MSPPFRLLAVLAHPDDESLGLGGVLARYAAEGVETYLVTATRGERGRFKGIPPGADGHPGGEELARIRERELDAATRVLGIRTTWILGYGDGQVDRAPAREAVRRIAACMRRVRPHVVLTFGHDGAYGHPDHIAMCQFTTAAAVAAADPSFDGADDTGPLPPHAVSKLYYMASSQASWDAYQEAFKKLVSVVDGVEREARPWPEWAITTRVDTRAHWSTAWRAVSCHESQIGGYERLKHLSPDHHEALWGSQSFYRALSTANGGREREADLFEGLRGGGPPAPGAA